MSSDQQENPSEISALRCENDELKRKMAAIKKEHRHTEVKYALLKYDFMAMGRQMESVLAKETNILQMVIGFKTIAEEYKQKCSDEATDIGDSVNCAVVEMHSFDRSAQSGTSINSTKSLLNVNVEGETPFICEEDGCRERFARQRSLNRHLRTHTKPYVCDEDGCDERFAQPRGLKKHKETHKEENGLVVKESGSANDAAVKAHSPGRTGNGIKSLMDIKVAKPSGWETPFVCEINGCGKRFARQDTLKGHKQAHAFMDSNVAAKDQRDQIVYESENDPFN